MLASASVVPRCLTIATSDSGGGAGIQADLKAFARLGCHGMSAIVALTAQSTSEVRAVHEAPPGFIRAELEVLFDDIGVDAAKTGMLFSAPIVETVADFLGSHPSPLVVDPVMVAASGAKLLQDDAVSVLVERLFPLATVVTPNLHEACALVGTPYSDEANREELAEAIHALGAPAVVVTGGHGSEAVDWLYDGRRHTPIAVERYESSATHGAGCTHSAALTAFLARGEGLEEAARGAARVASEAVRSGLADIGEGSGPVDVFGLEAAVRPR
jgi:hydroxymethylpyrimidine/phosphomethylpyrimidine kinase